MHAAHSRLASYVIPYCLYIPRAAPIKTLHKDNFLKTRWELFIPHVDDPDVRIIEALAMMF